MRRIGFSTGALARNNVAHALSISRSYRANAVECSALRYGELDALAAFVMEGGCRSFPFVSFHAPSSFRADQEGHVVSVLKQLVKKWAISIVVHPDVIRDFSLWSWFGDHLSIENMDHRKPVGRTADELQLIFNRLPKARLCFDIGHAHEIDRSMSVGYEILRRFGNRISHLHASEVTDECTHQAFTCYSHAAFRKLVDLIPPDAPVILETDVPEARAGSQLHEAKAIFRPAAQVKRRPVEKRAKKKAKV